MKTGFKNPIAIKQNKQIKSPWNFDCPRYDQRTSCYVNAGSHYGVGHRQPVGNSRLPKSKIEVLPQHPNDKTTLRVSKVPEKNLPHEILE